MSKKDVGTSWRRAWGCTSQSLALFRIVLGLLLTVELVLRFRFLEPFYSETGTLPLSLLLSKVDDLYKVVCFLHCHAAALWQQQVLLSLQVGLAVLFTLGVQTRITSALSWYLYLSLTLRNTWMNYILDRYFHHLLFLAMFLPLDRGWCWKRQPSGEASSGLVISPATIAFKLLVVWIYADAGGGKLMDPLKGWSYYADPLPALDTYARHTLLAQYFYALVGPTGLRLLTPIVVYVELLTPPLALLGGYLGIKGVIYSAVGLIWALHLGIAAMLRNAALLSFVACSAWFVFLPIGWERVDETFWARSTSNGFPRRFSAGDALALLLIGSMVAGNFWLETISRECDQSVKHIWSTLLHNRWNVFVGAEEYVTWEIAPGLLQDGSVVDVWGRRDVVQWDLPGTGAPCTATARPGRWRSFPYLAGLEGEDAEALWSYLCREWDRENHVDLNTGRKLVRYNFFMLQADVLPNMSFSPTRKRLIQEYECIRSASTDEDEDGSKPANAAGIDTTGEEL